MFYKKNLALFFVFLTACSANTKPTTIQPTRVIQATPILFESSDVVLYEDSDQLYVSTLDGNIRQTIQPIEPIVSALLSPDAKYLVYVTKQSRDIFLVDLENNKENKLVAASDAVYAVGMAWSPDGKTIAFSCKPNEAQALYLCAVDIATRQLTILINLESSGINIPDGVISPAWSNDGSRIVYLLTKSPPVSSVKSSARHDVNVLDLKSSKTKPMFQDGDQDISLIFSPHFLSDNKTIIFSGKKNERNSIYKIDGKTFEVSQVISEKFQVGGNITLSPDRTAFLVFAKLDNTENSSFISAIFSLDGELLQQLNLPLNAQVFSWVRSK